VFASVACYPAKTTLPNGENAHCTVRPLDWWRQIFEAAGRNHPQIIWKLFVEQHEGAEPALSTDTPVDPERPGPAQ